MQFFTSSLMSAQINCVKHLERKKIEIDVSQTINTSVGNTCSNLIVKTLYSIGSGSSWYQIENEMCHVPKVSNVSVEKGYLC